MVYLDPLSQVPAPIRLVVLGQRSSRAMAGMVDLLGRSADRCVAGVTGLQSSWRSGSTVAKLYYFDSDRDGLFAG